MSNIKYKRTNSSEWLDIETFTFSGGEVQVKVKSVNFYWTLDSHGNMSRTKAVDVLARIQSSEDVMTLVMTCDAIRELAPNIELRLHLPYVPYARQDRSCSLGEANGIRAFARLINSLDFAAVVMLDPHSDVTPALINKSIVINPASVINLLCATGSEVTAQNTVIVSPDAGAYKKSYAIAKQLERDLVMASKVRCTNTGAILRTDVYGTVVGKDCWIFDDICDGGRTFVELAKVLKDKGAVTVNLFVTHGIFSKGAEEVFCDGLIDTIWTTNSWSETQPHPEVKVLKVINQFGTGF